MKDTLPNGLVVEGTMQQINQVRKSLGFTTLFVADGLHYQSASRGVIRIADMDTKHIKNAVRKRFSNGISSIDTNGSLSDFIEAVRNTLSDVTLLGLLQQLQLRYARGER